MDREEEGTKGKEKRSGTKIGIGEKIPRDEES